MKYINCDAEVQSLLEHNNTTIEILKSRITELAYEVGVIYPNKSEWKMDVDTFKEAEIVFCHYHFKIPENHEVFLQYFVVVNGEIKLVRFNSDDVAFGKATPKLLQLF